jgi:hypothetical protein
LAKLACDAISDEEGRKVSEVPPAQKQQQSSIASLDSAVRVLEEYTLQYD